MPAIPTIGNAFDPVRTNIMIYDFCWSTGCDAAWNGGRPPGPINPHWWVDQLVRFGTTRVDPAKVMIGVPFYAYDWPVGGQGAAARSRAGIAYHRLTREAGPTSAGIPRYWSEVHSLIETYQPTIEWWEDHARGPIRQPAAARWRVGRQDQ